MATANSRISYRVALEACACGTLVICSKGCGIADVIDSRAGFAVSYDEQQLQEALLQILGNDKMQQEFGDKGKELVRNEFSWKNIIEKIESIYQLTTRNSGQ